MQPAQLQNSGERCNSDNDETTKTAKPSSWGRRVETQTQHELPIKMEKRKEMNMSWHKK